jgi:hypothetical protein
VVDTCLHILSEQFPVEEAAYELKYFAERNRQCEYLFICFTHSMYTPWSIFDGPLVEPFSFFPSLSNETQRPKTEFLVIKCAVPRNFSQLQVTCLTKINSRFSWVFRSQLHWEYVTCRLIASRIVVIQFPASLGVCY